MTKVIYLLLVLNILATPFSGMAQKTTSAKKASTIKKKKKTAPVVQQVAEIAEEPLLEMEGNKVLYMGKSGDQLIYEVNAAGQTYDFIITLLPEKKNCRYSFNWEMTAPVNKKGHADISKEAAYDSKKYLNYFSGGNLYLTDACTIWMTGSNFGDMPDKKTTMQLDNNEPEPFYRKDEAETAYDVIYKGKQVTLDIFKVDNDKTDGTRRQMWIQGISAMPLIVKMDLGWTIRLKEIK